MRANTISIMKPLIFGLVFNVDPFAATWIPRSFEKSRLINRNYLLPLNRAGGLAGDVVDHTVDAAHFVDNAVAHPRQHLPEIPESQAGFVPVCDAD